jgi:hypothetical protein
MDAFRSSVGRCRYVGGKIFRFGSTAWLHGLHKREIGAGMNCGMVFRLDLLYDADEEHYSAIMKENIEEIMDNTRQLGIIVISKSWFQRNLIKSLDGESILNEIQIKVLGMTDNSVIGMNMALEQKPFVIVMPQFMTFWNADGMIRHATDKGFSGKFIVVVSDAEEYETSLVGNAFIGASIAHDDFRSPLFWRR